MKLDFLDYDVAMEYCAGDDEIYDEVLEGYLEEDRREELTQYFDAKDWPNYRIVVHAVKSTSLTIGAVDLSANAKALELAAAENNADFVVANHAAMMAQYGEVLSGISKAFA